MAKLSQLSGKKLCKILEKEGFALARQTGSHRILQKVQHVGCVLRTISIAAYFHIIDSIRPTTTSWILLLVHGMHPTRLPDEQLKRDFLAQKMRGQESAKANDPGDKENP